MKAGYSFKRSTGWPYLFAGIHSKRFVLTIGPLCIWAGKR